MEPPKKDDEAQREEDERAAEMLRRFREDQARRAAEQKARDDEARRRREADEQVAREEESARSDALAKQRAEEEARRQAEDEQRRQEEARAREQQLALTLAQAEKLRQDTGTAALRDQRAKEATAQLRQEMAERTRGPAPGGPCDRRRRTVSIVFLLAVIGVVALHFVHFDGATFEKAAAARLGVPVKIGATRFSTLPLPALHFERVAIGPAGEVKIATVTVKHGLRTILEPKKHFTKVELDGAQIPLSWFTAALWEQEPDDTLRIDRLVARRSTILVPGLEPLAFNGEAEFDAAGALRSLHAETPERSSAFSIEMKSGTAQVTYSAKPFRLPFPGTPELDDFTGSGTLTRSGLVVTRFDATVLGGSFVGNARLDWTSGWSLEGAFAALSMDPARLVPTLVPTGRLEGKGTFSMRAPAVENLADNARFDATFSVHRGTLGFVDLTRVLQGGATRGGTTTFSRMDGTASVSRGSVHLRQIRIAAGLLNATGEVVVDPGQNLDGRFRAEIASQANAVVTLGGTIAAPQVRR